jgi:hypothetical protein
MAAKKKTTKKTEAGQQRSSRKRSPAKKKPVPKKPTQEPGSRPAAQKAPAKKTAEKTVKQLSALDAAAQVLAETGRPMNCREMIEAMAEKGYWTSPTGKTPSATLYSAILRELKAKGESARFQKVERGRFTLAQAAR